MPHIWPLDYYHYSAIKYSWRNMFSDVLFSEKLRQENTRMSRLTWNCLKYSFLSFNNNTKEGALWLKWGISVKWQKTSTNLQTCDRNIHNDFFGLSFEKTATQGWFYSFPKVGFTSFYHQRKLFHRLDVFQPRSVEPAFFLMINHPTVSIHE